MGEKVKLFLVRSCLLNFKATRFVLVYDCLFLMPKETSKKQDEEFTKLSAKPHWFLIVDYIPDSDKQRWTMFFKPGGFRNTNRTDGEGDAKAIVNSVCSIVKKRGGSVEDGR
jgi:hypothetical protein